MFARRKKSFLACLVLMLTVGQMLFGEVKEEEVPIRGLRIPESFVSLSYLPSLAADVEDALRYHSQFGIRAGFFNLLRRGPHLHFFFDMQHSLGSAAVLVNRGGIPEYLFYPQSHDLVGASLRSVFWSFFEFNMSVDYIQNRLLTNVPGHGDYNFTMVRTRANLGYHVRRSDFELWYEGRHPMYPHRGGFFSLGVSDNRVINRTNFLTLEGASQVIFPLTEWWAVSFSLNAQGALESIPRPYKLSTFSVGGPVMVGDYVGWGATEVRFYSPRGGWRIYTPPFWYFAAYDIRFVPGFLAGINGNIAGNYDTPLSFGYGLYAAPILGIYIMGGMAAILRFDIGTAQDHRGRVSLAIHFGAVNDRPSRVVGF